MSRVKVLHVITRLIQGGADENTLFTVNGLDPSRYEVGLLVGAGCEQEMLNRVAPQVEVIHEPALVRDLSPRADALATARTTALLARRRYDIVHTHLAKGGIVGRFAAQAARTPLIVHTLHGATFHPHLSPSRYRLYWGLEKATSYFTDRYLSVGEDLQQRYLTAGIGRPDQYQVIRSGMDLRAFEEASRLDDGEKQLIKASLGLPGDARVVGMVARLEPRKGHSYFIDAAEQLSRRFPDVHFVGIGAGPLLESLRGEVDSRGLGGRVHFVGFRSDIARVMSVLDVAVLTSLWEGLPRVLVQAAVCGVPAVTFEVEGAWEVVKEGQNGHIVPSRDVGALVDRLGGMLADPARTRAMGAAGRALVHDGWTVESMVNAIAGCYETLLARRSGA